jgi:hypothetical protein
LAPNPRISGDSSGLPLCGAGEWLLEKYRTKTCRSRRKHMGIDDNIGEIVAAALSSNDVDDASRVGPCWRWEMPGQIPRGR